MLNHTPLASSHQRSINLNLIEIMTLIDHKTSHSSRPTGDGYKTKCPAHNDDTPSLSISKGNDGKVLLRCHAGCTLEKICEAAGISMRDLFPKSSHDEVDRDHSWLQQKPIALLTTGTVPVQGNQANLSSIGTPMITDVHITQLTQPSKITKYHYKDAHGKIFYTKVKKEDSNGKTFYWEHANASGNTIIGMPRDSDKVLYNLPAVLEAIKTGTFINLVEGEKDAETLIANGFVATTSTETVTWRQSHTDLLKDAYINLLFDYDKAGFKRRDTIIEHLAGNVKTLRIIELPEMTYSESHGIDITDWLNEGHSIAELQEIIAKTPPYQPVTTKLKAVPINLLLSLPLPPRTMLLDPFLPRQGLVLLVAKRGVGKTHVALGIAYAVASGGQFLRWSAPEAKRVLYVDGEMPAVVMQERLKMIEAGSITKASPQNLALLTPDLQEDGIYMPDLSRKEGRDALEEMIKDTDLIVLDNISCLFRTGGENEAETWQDVQSWALELRKRGKSVLFVHHAGKNGGQRGTSKREDTLDAVISLRHPDGYKPADGAHFEVIFDKARHFHGEDAYSFTAKLKIENGMYIWETSDTAEEVEITEIARLKKEGATIEYLTQKTKLTKAQIEGRLKKAKQMGLL